MRNRLHLLVLTAAVTLFVSCNRNTVQLSDTNAKGEVQPLGNLVFRFSKQLMPDSLLNRWDSIPYVEFEPKIQGRFRWEHGDELIFSPASPLAPATTYKAKIGSEVLAYSKYGKVSTEDDLEFHTPDLQLENSNITWVLQDDAKSNAVPQVDLYFNYAVTPAVLKDKLDIMVDGEKKDYSVQTINNDKKITLRILQVKAVDKDFDAVIKIDKGLVPDGGQNSTKEGIEEKFTIPSPYSLTITNVESRHDGLSATVKIFTSQQVVADGLNSFVKISPAVKYSVEVEEDGILISGDAFDVQKTYDLVLSKGLRGKLGGTLKENYNGNIAFGELEPDISFSNKKAVYLSLNGLKNIDVRITGMPKVRVVISKIYENNLLAAHKYGYYPKSEGSYDDYYYDEEGGDATLGDVIYEKEIDTRTLPKLGSSRLFNFNVTDKIKDFNGIYHLQIRSTEDYWIKDSRFISLSDIGLIAKEGKDKMLVFANSIKTAASLNGVNVTVYGANNQVLGLGTTNSDGVAEIAYTRKEMNGFKPAMIIAKTADDFNYLPFFSTRVNTSRFDVSGKAYSAAGMDAFIYAERDIYRPGEKINANVLLRTADWKSPGELPVKFKFIMPNGKELKNFRKTLNEQGSAELSFELPQSAITGSYQLELYSGNDVLLSTKTFSVEEFVPDRIKVSAQLGKTFLTSGDSTSLRINAVNFFGPPAANRDYECEIQFKQTYFSPAKYENYTFSLTNHQTFFDKILRDGKTDANGNAVEGVGVPGIYKNMGLLSANIYTTVFDETGRPVSRLATANVYTQSVFYGLGYDGYYYYPLNQTIQFPLVALNKDEKPVNAQAKLQVIKHEYRTVLSKSGEYFRYESQKQDVIIKDDIVTVNGDASKYNFVPRQPGDYEVRLYAPGAETYVSRSFYSYGSWGTDNSTSFEVNTEGQIDISIDKKEYKTGDKAEILFKTPFSGRMLVTFETDKVISYQYVNVEKRSASVTLPLSEQHLPNVYVTATLIKPHTVSEIPLTVAHGFQSLKVDAPDRKIDVQITSAKTTRSRTHQKIKVKAAPNSYVTLAAVDNGVLQVSNMKTPDPYSYFYQRKELGVEAFDLYPLLFPELRARLSSTGGDGGEMEKRNNPMPNRRIKIVSYWSGVQKANGSGEVNFEFDVPQFSGEIRLMAVAYKDEKFGSAENNMTVADPVVISTGLPRFLSPGDTVLVPVTLSNTTKSATSAKVHLKVSGPLNVVGAADQQTSLAANAENRAVFKIVAQQRIDSGSVRVEVNALGEKFFDETQITVRPPSTLQKESGSGNITGGANHLINIPVTRFMQGSADYQLIISKSPAIELGDQLKYLVQYPYGCTEQTVSSAFPQLYFGDLADALKKNRSSASTAVANINEAIRKIKMRQLYNGSVTLWDDEGTANWWATVYAAHFLIEARKAGYDVDNSLTETMLGYLTTRLKTKETIDYFYNRTLNKKIAPKEVAYSLYVLALANRPQISVMNYYKSNPQMLALDSKYLLAAAYAQSGDKKSFAAMLPTAFIGEVSVAQTGGSFYSDVRDEAIALNVLIDVDPGNAQIPIMAKHVSGYLKQRVWLSTQERAFGFLSLGKLARTAAKSNVTADVKVNGKTVGTLNGGDLKLSAKQLGGSNVQIATSGSGRLYYYWVAEGVSTTGSYKEEDSYIKVRRQFYNRFGQLISGNSFEQNELVIVKVSLEKSFATSIENIVITDILPAGFEIENPRTKEIPGMDWIKDASSPTALDVRDDRIHLFVDLNTVRQNYYYAVRAVSPGLYRMGPVSADAMYNGEYHSYNGAGTVEVRTK
ncbi:MAG: MG2 domain-containing protein [Lacibacter sp.]